MGTGRSDLGDGREHRERCWSGLGQQQALMPIHCVLRTLRRPELPARSQLLLRQDLTETTGRRRALLPGMAVALAVDVNPAEVAVFQKWFAGCLD